MRQLLLAVMVVVSACGVGVDERTPVGTSESPLSYEEFKARTLREPDTGIWVLNMDEIAETEVQLRESYDEYVQDFIAARSSRATAEQPLIVNRVSGRDDKWSATAARNITYCISSSSFGTRYSTVVSAMNSATAAWESAGNVNFVHSSAQDGSCTRTNNNVVFNVRLVSGQSYLARAFFPSSSRSAREILIDSSSFGNISPWTLTGILRHELGHTLGFRHEHTRPEAGTCYEDSNWRALTAYDSRSVMHYPQCNGTQTGDLVLTSLDQQGARSLYP
ncbi:MAG: M57 family metalloprotease [Myxococcota bacterium]